jgi:hypothetical protein
MLLTVAQTLRLRGPPVLDDLAKAVDAHRHNLPTPKLLPTHGTVTPFFRNIRLDRPSPRSR